MQLHVLVKMELLVESRLKFHQLYVLGKMGLVLLWVSLKGSKKYYLAVHVIILFGGKC